MKQIKLSVAEISHILTLIESNEREGSYYSPKDHYWRRSDRIKRKLQEITKDIYMTVK
jgi:hypothetical protein